MNKITKFFITSFAVLSSLFGLTGCTPEQVEEADALDNKLTIVLKNNANENETFNLAEFKLIGTDVDKTGFNFTVNFNGVSASENGKKAFTTINYMVPSSEFSNISKHSSTSSVYDVFNNIVDNYEMNEYTHNIVSNLSNVNDAFVKNAPSPIEGFSINNGVVYNLSEPVFNDTEKSITFDVKTLINLTNRVSSSGFGVSYGFNGSVTYGYGIPITSSSAKGKFTTTDTYTITVDPETYDSIKNNDILVYDFASKAIRQEVEATVSAERKLTEMVTYNAADIMKHVDVSDLEKQIDNQKGE